MKTNIILTGLIWLIWLPLQAQPVVTLDACYAAARTHYPLLKQHPILQETGDLAIESLRKNHQLPQLSVNGQATWQSEVTKLPIELPNFSVPALSKDQYKLTLDASYVVYDGNSTRLQTNLQRANTATAQQQINVELNRLNDQVNGLFMNALLTDENLRLTQTLLADLHNRMDKLTATVRYGTAAQMNLDALQAELLRNEQRIAELSATRQGLRKSLQLLTNLPITDSTQLVVGSKTTSVDGTAINRPELQLYQTQRAFYDAQLRLAENKIMPRLSLFAQGGAGRPALNFLKNDFRGFFIGGLRLNWNLSAAYTLRNDRQIIALNRQTIDIQQAVFEQNIALQLRQQQTEIDRLEAQLSKDAAIVALRSKVRQAAAVQLDNGVIAARDYTTELYSENQAQLNQKLHELQLLLAHIQYRTILGKTE